MSKLFYYINKICNYCLFSNSWSYYYHNFNWYINCIASDEVCLKMDDIFILVVTIYSSKGTAFFVNLIFGDNTNICCCGHFAIAIPPGNMGPTILICIHFQTFHLCWISVVDFPEWKLTKIPLGKTYKQPIKIPTKIQPFWNVWKTFFKSCFVTRVKR